MNLTNKYRTGYQYLKNNCSGHNPPTISDVKDSPSLLGKPALLRCEAMAVPPAEFQWFKDDKQEPWELEYRGWWSDRAAFAGLQFPGAFVGSDDR
ncbi:UNVERIFIED_CONTAM: hypothetical protein K2H54_024021 [Gekko kuhli]